MGYVYNIRPSLFANISIEKAEKGLRQYAKGGIGDHFLFSRINLAIENFENQKNMK